MGNFPLIQILMYTPFRNRTDNLQQEDVIKDLPNVTTTFPKLKYLYGNRIARMDDSVKHFMHKFPKIKQLILNAINYDPTFLNIVSNWISLVCIFHSRNNYITR